MKRTADVAILGAGAAGLAAADHLLRAGLDVVVVEARERLGGRVETVQPWCWPSLIELGAEFVHGRPAAVLARCRAARLKVAAATDHWVWQRGKLRKANAAFEAAAQLVAPEHSGPDVSWARAMARKRRAGEVDAGDAAGRAGLRRGFLRGDPRHVSTYFLDRMQEGAEEAGAPYVGRVVEGYEALLQYVARRLPPERLLLSAEVTQVRWSRSEVELRIRGLGGSALRLRAGKAITLPVPLLAAGRGPRFIPALRDKSRAAAKLEMGAVVKIVLRFRSRFWKPKDLTFVHRFGAPIPTWWTLAPRELPLAVGWVGGPAALRLSGRSSGALLQTAVSSSPRRLVKPRAGSGGSWMGSGCATGRSEPFSQGAYLVVPPGQTHLPRVLAAPVEQTLFFAGEATHLEGQAGTVHGALETGVRAAKELLTARR